MEDCIFIKILSIFVTFVGQKCDLWFYCVFQALEQAAGMSIQVLHTRHVEVWQELWTTGFGISHSYADNAINGAQVMITVVEKPWGSLGLFRQLLTGQLKLEKNLG
jgi:hypothetical protein